MLTNSNQAETTGWIIFELKRRKGSTARPVLWCYENRDEDWSFPECNIWSGALRAFQEICFWVRFYLCHQKASLLKWSVEKGAHNTWLVECWPFTHHRLLAGKRGQLMELGGMQIFFSCNIEIEFCQNGQSHEPELRLHETLKTFADPRKSNTFSNPWPIHGSTGHPLGSNWFGDLSSDDDFRPWGCFKLQKI